MTEIKHTPIPSSEERRKKSANSFGSQDDESVNRFEEEDKENSLWNRLKKCFWYA